MNPKYPSEAVALQGTSGPVAGHQYATVNMAAEPPKDHIVWSLWSFLYGNFCCLGLAALIFSVKARDRKLVGDVNGAQSYGSKARYINIVATILTVLTVLTVAVIIIVVAVST